MAALPVGAQVQQVALQGGGVRLYLVWPGVARMKIDCSRDEWLFQSLTVEDAKQQAGFYTACVDGLSVFTRGLGVKRWKATATDEVAKARLLTRGGWAARYFDLTWEL